MITPKRLIKGISLDTTYGESLYTVVDSVKSATIKQLIVCNTDTVVRSFSYQVRPSGATSGIAYTLFNEVPIQPNETLIFSLTDVIETSYEIHAVASEANVVSLTVSGMENT